MLITTGKISQAEVLNDCIAVVASAIFSSAFSLSKHDILGQRSHSGFASALMLALPGKSASWHPAHTACFSPCLQSEHPDVLAHPPAGWG